jgi:hypothetical protein
VNWKNRVDPWPQTPTAIRDCRDGGREATGRLVALLAAIETTEDENSGLMALRLLAETPKTVLRLDEPIRRGRWSSPNYSPTIDKIGERVKAGFGSPIAVAAGIEELLSVADKDADILLRSRTAEAAAREAVWTKRTKTLRQPANSKYPEVRALAVTGPGPYRARRGSGVLLGRQVVAGKRARARRTGVDPLRYYRKAVTAEAPSYGAIAGLAEIVGEADAPLPRNLLAHRLPRIRLRALRGLRLLNTVPIAEVTQLLRNPSPAVVREATTALSRKR